MSEVNITYETLFDLLRKEKTRDELQKFDENFLNDVMDYLKEKKALLESLKTKNDLFAAGEKKRTEVQYENIIKIISELYERREKKIIMMALDKSRASASVVDTTALMKEENVLYQNLVELFNSFRRGILCNILEAKRICVELPKAIEMPEEEEKKEEQKSDKKKVKISEFVPKFVGTDLKEYGPFEAEDEAELPDDVAELLIEKGSAEPIL